MMSPEQARSELANLYYQLNSISQGTHLQSVPRLTAWRLRADSMIGRLVVDGVIADHHRNRFIADEPRDPVSWRSGTLAEYHFKESVSYYQGFVRGILDDLGMSDDDLRTFGRKRVPGGGGGRNPAPTILPVASSTIFVIHGHDDASLLRLTKLLKDEWALDSIVLREEAGRSQTLIERIEQAAPRVGFAIALLTPDDEVKKGDGHHFQARPNVLIELGWFFGKLGRKKTVMIAKRGIDIPSDLQGITRMEFGDRVEEVMLPLKRELEAAGLVNVKF